MTNSQRRNHRGKILAVSIIVLVFCFFAFALAGRAEVSRSLSPPSTSSEKHETVQNMDAAVDWLSDKAHQMVRASRRKMHDGTTAFPPQVDKGYNAFWLRDYCYVVEGAAESLSEKELKDACRLFVGSIREDGAGVDCIKFDGTPIYKPGYGRMGKNPVADGSPFTVGVAWHTFFRTKDIELLRSIIDKLEKTMDSVPRNPKTGLVHIKPGKSWDRCPYGFTDTIPKQGDVLFSSLLFVDASRHMADLHKALGREEDARRWSDEAKRMTKQIRKVFWNPEWGLFRAATVKCNQPDIWGSAFAVSREVATREQALAIARYFRDHYDELVERGQIRHLPRPMYWEGVGYRDRYQNGGYWATPVGWFVYTLDLVDSKLADKTVIDMTRDFQQWGVHEWIYGDRVATPTYLASVTTPLLDICRMLIRRQMEANDKPRETTK